MVLLPQQLHAGVELQGDQQQIPDRHPGGETPQQLGAVGQPVRLPIHHRSGRHQQRTRQGCEPAVHQDAGHLIQPGWLEKRQRPGLQGEIQEKGSQQRRSHPLHHPGDFLSSLPGKFLGFVAGG